PRSSTPALHAALPISLNRIRVPPSGFRLRTKRPSHGTWSLSSASAPRRSLTSACDAFSTRATVCFWTPVRSDTWATRSVYFMVSSCEGEVAGRMGCAGAPRPAGVADLLLEGLDPAERLDGQPAEDRDQRFEVGGIIGERDARRQRPLLEHLRRRRAGEPRGAGPFVAVAVAVPDPLHQRRVDQVVAVVDVAPAARLVEPAHHVEEGVGDRHARVVDAEDLAHLHLVLARRRVDQRDLEVEALSIAEAEAGEEVGH